MGTVWRATQLAYGRAVVVKLIADEHSQDPAFRARFQREWQIAAGLEHPNVVPVYEAGEEDGRLFIVMRYVEGADLREILAREGALDPRRAAELVAQTAAALDEAHRHGLTHRDVKPANVLVERAGEREHVYLTDFGLTRRQDESQALTASGAWVGTPDYAAPEQLREGCADARSDVYSLGCVLFEALCGETPFPRATAVATAMAHVSDRAPVASQRLRALASEWDDALRRALAKRPDDRFPSAGDLGRAAIATAEGRPRQVAERSVARGAAVPDAPTVTEPFVPGRDRAARRRRRPAVAGGIALLAAAGAAVAVVVAMRGDDSRPVVRSGAAPSQPDARPGTATRVAVSCAAPASEAANVVAQLMSIGSDCSTARGVADGWYQDCALGATQRGLDATDTCEATSTLASSTRWTCGRAGVRESGTKISCGSSASAGKVEFITTAGAG